MASYRTVPCTKKTGPTPLRRESHGKYGSLGPEQLFWCYSCTGIRA